jgi:uncharacterized protein YdaU (DUF1376 family)
MNYFKFWIGDYQRDTGTLSPLEHGIYVLMLVHYYGTEKPLPFGKDLYRLLRADTKPERRAVDVISGRYWEINTEGLINRRALLEIHRAAQIKAQNKEIGKLGGRRKVDRSVTQPLTERLPNANPNHSHSHSHNQEKKESSRGASAPANEYVWEGSVIQLNARDYGRWKNFFRAIPDFDAELATADAYYRDHPPKGSWFHAVSRWLKKAHEEGLRREKEEYDAKHSWN